MFAKLLKYEFKATGKPVIYGGLAAILAGILGSLILYFLTTQDEVKPGQEILYIVMALLLMGIFISIMAYYIAPTIIVLYRFYKHHFSDEGYLTFTVPATTHQILFASILNFFICGLIAAIFVFISISILIFPILLQAGAELDFFMIPEIFESVFSIGTVIAMVLLCVSSIVYYLIMPLVAITLGSLIAKKHKILCAFAVGYGINMAISFVSGIGTGIVSITTFINDAAFISAYNISILVPALLFLGFGVGGYFLMHRLIKNNLNI